MSKIQSYESSSQELENLSAHLINDLNGESAASEAARAFKRVLENPEISDDSETINNAKKVYHGLKTEESGSKYADAVITTMETNFKEEFYND